MEKNLLISKKQYEWEELCDVDREVYEAFDTEANGAIRRVPLDKDGNYKGEFTITITWEGT